jgi:hypothetical protein
MRLKENSLAILSLIIKRENLGKQLPLQTFYFLLHFSKKVNNIIILSRKKVILYNLTFTCIATKTRSEPQFVFIISGLVSKSSSQVEKNGEEMGQK